MLIDFVSVFALYGNDYNIVYQRDNESKSLCEGKLSTVLEGKKSCRTERKKSMEYPAIFYG